MNENKHTRGQIKKALGSAAVSGMIGVLGFGLTNASAEVSRNQLLGYYPMNGDSQDHSNAVGGSSSANDAVWSDASVYQNGMFGQAATVGDGAGGHYLSASGAEYVFGSGSFSVVYWVNVSGAVSSDPVLIAGGGKNWSSSGGTLGWVSTISDDNIKANVSDGSTRKDTSWVDLDPGAGSWSLVALVVDRDAGVLSNYVLDDNVTTIGDDASAPSSQSIAGLGSFTGSNNQIVMGQDGDGAGYGSSYPGLPATGIDDVSIWGRALSQDEIQAIYTSGRAGQPLGNILSALQVSLDDQSGEVQLDWDAYDLAGLTSPEIRVSRDGSVIATLAADRATFTDSPSPPRYADVVYQYSVALYDGGDVVADSLVSAELQWDLEGLPQNLSATADSLTGQVTLMWAAVGSGFQADGVQVFRDDALIATLALGASSYVDTPPLPVNQPVTYTYKLRAYGGWQGGGHTDISAQATLSPGGLANGLIANYRFEDGFKDTASAAVVHPGAPVNRPAISGNGVYGHAVTFSDQLQQGIWVADHDALDFGDTGDFTVSFWMKRWGVMNSSLPNGEAGDGVLICKQNWSNGASPGWGVYATSDGGVKWNIAGSSRKSGDIASGASGLADGRWHHILVSCSRSASARCFVDGQFVKAINISGAGSVDNALPLAMGLDGNGNYSWKGEMDEVAVWNRALGDNEAIDVFRASTKGLALSGKSIVDSDADGMDDAWEKSHFGDLSQHADGDADRDGLSNYREFAEGSNPSSPQFSAVSRVSEVEIDGQSYPVLHYMRPELDGDISYVPEASADLANWMSGEGRFIPHGNPIDLGNGQREYQLRYYQSVDAVATGRVMMRVRMESRYQAAIAETIEPTVELRNGQAIVSWTTAQPTVTVINYGADGQTTSRYEDYTLKTHHEVVINMDAGKEFTYTVIQVGVDGIESRSKTYTVSGLWDYSPPPVPEQFGYDSGGNWSARADEILSQPGILDRGYCLDYLCGDGRLAYELARKSQMVVIGVEDTQAEVDAARAFLVARGVYGSRVSIVLASDLSQLPFAPDFFNLIVSQSHMAQAGDFEMLKSAVEFHSIPGRGWVAGLKEGEVYAEQKAERAGTGVWSMSYGNPSNTASSTEEFSGKTTMGGFELRWLGSPGPELAWDRQTAEQPPLAMNGRFYCQGRGRILALDSHNGCVLWSKELDDAQRFNMLRDAGNLSADADAVWLSLRKECWRMDGDTGQLTSFPLVEGPRSDLDYCWNYVCSTDGHLLGSASVDEAFYKGHWGSQFWYSHVGGSLANQVMSDNLFSINPSDASVNWAYQEGLILSVTITVGDGKIYFLETRNESAVAGVSRRLATGTWKQDLYLVCLDLASGAKLWEKESSFSGGTQTVFLMYDGESKRVILSAGDGGTNYLYGYDPADGSPVWNQSAACYKTDHGGKNQHPVIVNGEVLLTPNVFDALTGVLKRSDIPKNNGQGCNTYWGSKNLLFYRTGYSGQGLSMWPIRGGSRSGIEQVKGACWLNWAPADGIFLIQEKSAGCSCGQWVHISQGWGPKQN
ncbi:hypothetical protein HW115_17315 [Verrucomicrobiaceae bacterium N1E253]|uniref:LamG-like jellyroll fold domain-containing protein n=1 Tax=Oceaniferula marina TaxID=2748318 RepID=A0A851GIQ8_9BACT|nr:LamG-like jellyroll fold domain-containing protein [Oceaniferula marina]NWK57383.1 hypothetical protein [Oceaniferula marina]